MPSMLLEDLEEFEGDEIINQKSWDMVLGDINLGNISMHQIQ